MYTVLFAFVGLALFDLNAEGAITAWTMPPITSPTSGSGSGLLSTTSVNEGLVFSVTVAATSDITSPAAALTYTLGPKSPDVAWTLASGLLSLAAGITDFETDSTYVLRSLSENAAVAGTATCTLSLNDVNEAPAFTGTSLTATIADRAAAGTTLGTYTATDPDTGNTVTYSIFSGNTNTDFAIATSTGVVTVATEKTLSIATTPSYSLVLYAVDSNGSPLTGTTTVSVTVGSSGAAAITACFITVIIGIFVNVMK